MVGRGEGRYIRKGKLHVDIERRRVKERGERLKESSRETQRATYNRKKIAISTCIRKRESRAK